MLDPRRRNRRRGSARRDRNLSRSAEEIDGGVDKRYEDSVTDSEGHLLDLVENSDRLRSMAKRSWYAGAK